VKEFHVGSNYLVNATVRLENTSGKSISLPAQEWVVGTATPMGPDDNGLNEGVMWYNGVKGQDFPLGYFSTNTTSLFFFPELPRPNIARAQITLFGRQRTINFSRSSRC